MGAILFIISFIAFYILFSFAPAIIANNKGRCGICYFFLSLIISPLLAIIITLVLSEKTQDVEQAKLERGELKRCTACAEPVQLAATKCKHCGEHLEATAKQETSNKPTKHEPTML